MFAKLSTAKTVLFGPVLDSSGAEYTGAAAGDVKICKNNGTPAALNGSATLTHKEVGLYELALTASDISEVGVITIVLSKTTYVAAPVRINVLPALVYDSLVGGTDNLQVDAIQVSGDAAAADNLEAMLDGTGGVVLKLSQLVISANAAAGAFDIANAGAGPGIKVVSVGNALDLQSSGGAGLYSYGLQYGLHAKCDATQGYMAANFEGGPQEGVMITGTTYGLYCWGGSGTGIFAQGSGAAGAGFRAEGGLYGIRALPGAAAGYGVHVAGGSTGGNAVVLEAQAGNWDAVVLTPSGTGVGISGTLSDKTGYALTSAYDAAKTAATQASVNAVSAVLSGITSLAAWLRGLFRKSAMDATAQSEVNAGGGTYDETTDSNEAIRDRGDAAWGASGVPTAAENADAVWDELLAGHVIVGSAGAALSAAGNAGDPWITPLPGSYGAGTAGHIIGTALPDIAPGAAGGLPTGDASNQIAGVQAAGRNAIADAVLLRDIANVEGSAGEHSLCYVVLAMSQSNTVDQPGMLTVYKTDGVSEFVRKTLRTSPDADPVTGVS